MSNPNTSSPLGRPTTPMAKQFIGAVEDHWELYSDQSTDYTIGSPIGFGASSIVYSAFYKPADRSPIPVALKVLDLDSLPPRSLSLLQRETTLMSLSKHPNVLRVRGSWMEGHKLHIAMRLMNKGSAADVMHYGWPGGMEEDVVRCILQQALLGLNYLHTNKFIHRDVKAANLLCDDDGTVLLGDLGVAANLAEDSSQNHHASSAHAPALNKISNRSRRSNGSHDSGRRVVLVEPPITALQSPSSSSQSSRPKIFKRKSFVGTPCWMAPELIQGQNYDSSADIWSFGITALELTQGRPPRSRESPQKVLLKIIQEAPPTLDREGGTFKYSRAFQEMVASCLVKDPSQRPTAQELLQTPFFKNAKKPSYLIGAILKDLPPLALRQERRVVSPSHTTRQSIDSWDFATTVHSPAPSIAGLGRRVSEVPVFDMEFQNAIGNELEELDERVGHEPEISERRHSRAVSWAEKVEEETETVSEEGSDSCAPTSPSTSPDVGLPVQSPLPSDEKEESLPAGLRAKVEAYDEPPLEKEKGSSLWRKLKKNASQIKRTASISGGKAAMKAVK